MQLWSHVYSRTTVIIEQADITQQSVSAIVNAANEELRLGGGVAGAIREAGGASIQEECYEIVKKQGRVETGNVAVTGAGRLKCGKIIHAVGPRWDSDSDRNEDLLVRTLFSILECAEKEHFESIAIPAISSGIFGFPKEACAQVFKSVLGKYLSDHPETAIRLIKLVNIDQKTASIFHAVFSRKSASSNRSPREVNCCHLL